MDPLAALGADVRRRRLRAGLTQDQLAARVGFPRGRAIVSRCEQGKEPPSERFARGIDAVLGANGEITRLLRLVEAERLRQAANALTAGDAVDSPVGSRALSGEGPVEEAITNRREFGELAALSALAFETARRIDASSAAPTLGELEDDVADIAVSYDATPHPVLIAQVGQRWQQIEGMLDHRLSVTDGRRTTRLGGQLAYYLGRLAFAGGHYRDARRFCDLADRYAGQIDDDVLVGSLAALRSSIAYYTHRWDEAAVAAGRALQAAPPYLAARLAAYEARGHARLGRVRETENALAAMRRHAGAVTMPRPGSSPFTAGSMAMFSAVCALELGDGASTRRWAQDAIDLIDPRSHEERSHAYLCLATGFLLQDQPDPSAAVAASYAAASVPEGHLSATIVSAMAEVARDLRPWASDPDVRSFDALVHQSRLALPRGPA
ncbi:helix-turn-helix domain-containing protein [Protofrankia coriariae]|uniref:HTH cro/C1-type domain-containing protein n=1 Tax=Protofrankia coriariae TaxID=1562887 RepID=A0ABR5F4D4_9ACTN|nr:helix-turn-helix transcriptional regulator [Protofrankia coriariae]KLL11548.1 hypothetical protein FrCorBMG51_10930 [Protofrankia coriariae]